jgi:hypothetical protein
MYTIVFQAFFVSIFIFRFFGSMLFEILRDETPMMALEPLSFLLGIFVVMTDSIKHRCLIWLAQGYIAMVEMMVIQHMQRRKPWKIHPSVVPGSVVLFILALVSIIVVENDVYQQLIWLVYRIMSTFILASVTSLYHVSDGVE